MAKKVKKAKAAKKPANKAKKVAKKKPANKKSAAKKATKKKVKAKKVAKKKPVAKKVKAKKVVAKKPAKNVVAKVSKPTKVVVVQEIKKSIQEISKPVAQPKANLKPVKPSKKEASILDEEEDTNTEIPLEVLYKPQIKKANANQPKPYIGKDNRTRYSDDELAEFKEIIIEKLTEAQKDYELLKATLTHKDDHGTDDTSPTFKLLEDGSDVLSKEETAQLASRQEKFIQNLKNALIRIENKSYGICRATGRLISKERLRSVPHATLDIDAKLEQSF